MLKKLFSVGCFSLLLVAAAPKAKKAEHNKAPEAPKAEQKAPEAPKAAPVKK